MASCLHSIACQLGERASLIAPSAYATRRQGQDKGDWHSGMPLALETGGDRAATLDKRAPFGAANCREEITGEGIRALVEVCLSGEKCGR